MNNNKIGFSLTELMVSIAILSVLALSAGGLKFLFAERLTADGLAGTMLTQLDALRFNTISGKQANNTVVDAGGTRDVFTAGWMVGLVGPTVHTSSFNGMFVYSLHTTSERGPRDRIIFAQDPDHTMNGILTDSDYLVKHSANRKERYWVKAGEEIRKQIGCIGISGDVVDVVTQPDIDGSFSNDDFLSIAYRGNRLSLSRWQQRGTVGHYFYTREEDICPPETAKIEFVASYKGSEVRVQLDLLTGFAGKVD